MAILTRQNFIPAVRIDTADIYSAMPVRIDNNDPHAQPVRLQVDSNVVLVDRSGREIGILDLIKRLEALETDFMERTVLGKTE